MLQDGFAPQPALEINLKGTFEEMGVQYIQKLGPQILKQIEIFDKDLKIEDPIEAASFKAKADGAVNAFISNNKYPDAIMRMYRSMVETEFAVSNGLTLEKLIFLDLAIFLTTLHPKVIPPEWLAKLTKPESCSFFAITQDGKPEIGVGRNFDWPDYVMHGFTAQPVILHLDCTESDYPNYVTIVSHPGSISGFTFFTDNGLSWSVNSEASAMDVKIPGGIRFDLPYFAAAGVIDMFQARDFKDLLARTENSGSDYPVAISITGRNILETATVEKCPIDRVAGPGEFTNLTRTYGSTNTKQVEDIITDLGYAHTNLVHAKGWKKHLGHSPNQIAVSSPNDRLINLRNLINDLSTRSKSLMKSVQKYLSYRLDDSQNPGATKVTPMQHPYHEEISSTFYSTGYCPYKDTLKVTFQQCASVKDKTGALTSPMKVKTCRPN